VSALTERPVRGRRNGVSVTVTVAASLVLFWIPLIVLLRRAFAPGISPGQLPNSGFAEILLGERTRELFAVSIAQASASTLVSTGLGAAVGWWIGRRSFRGRTVLRALLGVPFALPSLVVAAAVIAMLGGVPTTMPGRLAAIVVGHVIFNFGFVARSVSSDAEQIPASLLDAARLSGRTRQQAERVVGWSWIRPGLQHSALIVFSLCLTSFGVVVALGGTSVSSVEVEIWYSATRLLDLSRAAVLALAQVAVVTMLSIWVERSRNRSAARGAAAATPRSASIPEVVGVVVAVAVFVVIPLGSLVVRSLRPSGSWTIEGYTALGERGVLLDRVLGDHSVGSVVANSVMVAVGVGLVATAIGLVAALAARNRAGARTALLLPLGISSTTLGLGHFLAYAAPGRVVSGSIFAVAAVQVAMTAPLATRLMSAGIDRVSETLLDAARMCGKSRAGALRSIGWPLVRPVAVNAGAFASAIALGDFGATVMVGRSTDPTLPMVIGSVLGRPGQASLAVSLSLSVVLVTLVGVLMFLASCRRTQ
jgi:thiamine transport system permease protein